MGLKGLVSPAAWRRRIQEHRRALALLRAHRYLADGVVSAHDTSVVLPQAPGDNDYRLYVGEWAARHADRSAPPDAIFVAVGTASGEHVHRILETVAPQRPYWLLDAWDGRRSRSNPSVKYEEATDFESIERSFSGYPDVHLLRGVIPESIADLPPAAIAFAYFCLGDTPSEIDALDILLPRLAKGGVVVLNGFGRRRTSDDQRRRFVATAQECDLQPLVLVTGQALLFA